MIFVTHVPVQVDGQWQSLPYEIASAYVRTLMIHCREFTLAEQKADELQALDPEEKKKKTTQAMENFTALKKAQRWIVLNPKTGQMATQSWLQKYIKSGPDGKPVLKDAKSKVKPWIMVFHFESDNGETTLSLQRDPSKPPEKVRCVDLRQGQSHGKLAFFMEGYHHFLEGGGDSDDGEEDSEQTMIGEDEGLEGLPKPCPC